MLGFTIDEKAIQQFGTGWLDNTLESGQINFVELTPEARAADLKLYLNLKKSLEEYHLAYQLHMPYFVHPTDYHVKTIIQSKQKNVNILENWFTYIEKLRYDNQCVPLIIHPALSEQGEQSAEDITAKYLDNLLHLLQRAKLDKFYKPHLENIPLRKGASFAGSIEDLTTFRNRYFSETEIGLCLDLCHYETNDDKSVIAYDQIPLYHIHQFSKATQSDHLSLQHQELDFKKHFDALQNLPQYRLNLELLLYAEPKYTERIKSDIDLLAKRLKY